MELNLHRKKVFVCHVKTGYQDREQHITQMLGRMKVPFEFITEGDIADLTPEVLNHYFGGGMKKVDAQTSCAYKHILACKAIVDQQLDGALVLEDDICLNESCFAKFFNKSLDELNELSSGASMISYEDTRLRFVPRSKRQKNKVLYVGDRDRMTGAYYVNHEAAKLVLHLCETQKMNLPCDWFYAELIKQHLLIYYWCQPTIASQGSHTGRFASTLNLHKSVFLPFLWQFKLHYKKLLYWFR